MKQATLMGWTTFDGRFTKLDEIDHQHLSNIIWFNQVFNNWNRYNSKVAFELGLELERRFKGIILPWAPLPIPSELIWLHEMGLITPNGDILGNHNTGLYEGKIIGSINHIKTKPSDKQKS